MRILFDTNVLLDLLLAREPFASNASFLLRAIDAKRIEGFVSATTVTDVHYIVRKQTKSRERALAAITTLLEVMHICAVSREILLQATALQSIDFEDNVQIACAMSMEVEVIVTRDAVGFLASPIPAMSPVELQDRIRRQRSL